MPYPYIPARRHGGKQSAVTRIVIHATVSPCVRGGARNVARYFQSQAAGGSAHYIVDPGEIVQAVKDNVVAHHAPPNTGTLGVELCDPQKGDPSRWADDAHEAMLRRAAGLVRELADKYNVPLVRLTALDLQKGKRGICGHVEVSRAFGRTDHGDPDIGGRFPWAHFMQLITEPEGLDMTPEQVYKAVWDRDAIPGPDKDPSNKTWKASSVLVDNNQRLRKVEAELASTRAALAEIKALILESKA